MQLKPLSTNILPAYDQLNRVPKLRREQQEVRGVRFVTSSRQGKAELQYTVQYTVVAIDDGMNGGPS
jgi:hypothetical protein